ncbi:MAG: hypothetical protein ACYDEY_08020 [Acidimicrobiales bacterium]
MSPIRKKVLLWSIALVALVGILQRLFFLDMTWASALTASVFTFACFTAILAVCIPPADVVNQQPR